MTGAEIFILVLVFYLGHVLGRASAEIECEKNPGQHGL